jgi:hypothetical protein
MKLRKFIMQLGLLLATLISVSCLSGIVASASTTALPSTVSPVSTDKSVYTTPTAGSINVVTGTALNGEKITSVPSIVGIWGNNLSSTNRLTDKTTEIYIAYKGTLATGSFSNYVKSAEPDITTTGGKSIVTSTESVMPSGGSVAILSATTYYKLNVNLTAIRNYLPMFVGLRVGVSNSTLKTEYYFSTITANSDIVASFAAGTTITGTTRASHTTNSSTVKSTDRKVSGTGEPGAELKMVLTDPDGSNEKILKTTVGADGKYVFQLDDMLKNLGSSTYTTNPPRIVVGQYDEMGDSRGTGADVKPVNYLVIKPSSTNIEVSSATVGSLAESSDATLIQWLVNQGGLTVTKDDGSALSSTDDLEYHCEETDIASKLSALGDGESATFHISADDKDDDSTQEDATVTVTRHNPKVVGSDLDFGDNVAVPTQETWYAPQAINVSVEDVMSGDNWSVYASSTSLTSASHTLDGELVYVDGAGQQESMSDTNVKIATGIRSDADKDTDNIAHNWDTGNSYTSAPDKQGIFLKAKGNPIADGEYTGTVTWTLSDTPSS